MSRGEFRHWKFWRREFWNRAVSWVVLAVGMVAVVPFAAVKAGTEVHHDHLLASNRFCAWSQPPCVDEVRVTLTGGYRHRREIGTEWTAWRGRQIYDKFHVRDRYDDDLSAVRDDVRVDVVDGDVIAVEVPGHRVPVWGLGLPGAVRAALLALTFGGLGITMLIWARRKAAAAGSWWSPDAPSIDQGTTLGMIAVMPAAIGLVLCIVGIPWWPVWAGTWCVLTALGVGSLVRWRGRPEGGEHRAPI